MISMKRKRRAYEKPVLEAFKGLLDPLNMPYADTAHNYQYMVLTVDDPSSDLTGFTEMKQGSGTSAQCCLTP